ncbi:MAG: hypothetical protein HFE68_00575 [Erysipelotrichaceae bacterium]|nr:hypothetical protein [Erysipelotrichaceae bacterium]MCI9311840.1 hypothetical protein [Erysipelotrichaceae bacterium]
MKNIDQKLIENKFRQKRKAYLQNELNDLTQQVARESATLQRLALQLDKESEDVERLEHASLNRIFATLSARSSLRLEKEKSELIRAALDYNLKAKDLEYLHYQKNLLEQELKPYDNLAQEYEALLEIKRKSLDMDTLNAVREMEAKWKEQCAQKQACEAAYESGKKLSSSFNFILDHLNELVEDTTEARSLWYPILSQEEIEDVSAEIAKLNSAWQSFDTLCKELPIETQPLDQGFLLKVSDYMLEAEDKRKLTKRINTSFEQLNTTYAQLRTVLNQLQVHLSELNHAIADQRFSIQACIETGGLR